MIRGLYTSASGMLKEQKKLDITANNMANVSTTGYKKDIAVFQSFPEMLTQRINDRIGRQGSNANIGDMSLGADVVQIYTTYNPGRMNQTNLSTDMGLENSDNAFFTVNVAGPAGNQEMYTRNGSWTLNQEGYLITRDGYIVLGNNGPIRLQSDQFTVQKDGGVYQNGNYIDTLRITEFTDTTGLRKYGNNMVQAPAGTQTRPFTGQVVQGSIEDSNVNSVEEMVEMINIMRSYEANQKAVKAYDDMLDKSSNEIGKV